MKASWMDVTSECRTKGWVEHEEMMTEQISVN